MGFQTFNFDDYPKENVEYLKSLFSLSTDKGYWDTDIINNSSEQGLRNINWLKINILLEAFVKYHESEISVSTTQKKGVNLDFKVYMSKAYQISNNIIGIFPIFKFLPNTKYALSCINNERNSYLPDDLPYKILNNINDELDSSSKLFRFEYFCDLLTANFNTEINQDNLNEFISNYGNEKINLEWVNSLIIDSYLSICIYQSTDLHFQPGLNKSFTLRNYRENYYQPKKRTFKVLFKLLKYRYSGVFKWTLLPSISIYLAILNEQLLSMLVLWVFGVQITTSYYINKVKNKNFRFIDIFSKHIETLIKIKQGLKSSIMHADYIIYNLTKIDEDKMFNLDNLISFLHVLKNKRINPINRVTIGLIKDIDLYKENESSTE